MAKTFDSNSNLNFNATGVILAASDWFEENGEPAFAAALREAGEAVARLKCELADCRTALNEVRRQRRDQESRIEYNGMFREIMTQLFPGGTWRLEIDYDELNRHLIFHVYFGNPEIRFSNDPASVRYSFTIDELTINLDHYQTIREIIYEYVLRIRSEFIKRIEENPRYSPSEWTITPGPPRSGPPRARRNTGNSLVTE